MKDTGDSGNIRETGDTGAIRDMRDTRITGNTRSSKGTRGTQGTRGDTKTQGTQGLLLVFSVTPFKIDQNKNQNRSIDKVQNLRNERRYI